LAGISGIADRIVGKLSAEAVRLARDKGWL
jgi:hypothetical protein